MELASYWFPITQKESLCSYWNQKHTYLETQIKFKNHATETERPSGQIAPKVYTIIPECIMKINISLQTTMGKEHGKQICLGHKASDTTESKAIYQYFLKVG